MTFTDEDIKRVVAETVRRELAPNDVRVSVWQDLNHQGDPMIRVVVVKNTNFKRDGRKMLGLIRVLRNELDRGAAEGFPSITYVSRRDASKMNLEFT